MFKNMKIGMRLGLGFSLILVLLVIMGIFSIIQMSFISDKVDKVSNDLFPKTISCNNIIDEINVVARALRNEFLLTDPAKISEEDARIDVSAKNISEEFKKLEATITSVEGKKLLANAMNARQEYIPLQTELRKLIKENKREIAISILLGKFRELQNNYMKTVSELITFQSDLTKKYGQEGHSAAQSSEMTIIILALAILLIGIFAAVFITKTITSPISKCIEIADKVAEGNTDVTITSDSKDETGQLLGALGKMVDSIKHLVADAGMLSKSAVDGKLDTRADATKHQGDYRKVVEGVNGTLDAMIGPLNVAAEYVDRISKGDIPQKITDNYNGDFNEIKNNLNQCIDAVNALVTDANLLSKAAVEGKLATRADATKHQGDFRKIVQGVNETLDAVIGPLNVSAEYVDRISKGDIPQKITDKYNGDFNEIKNNLNQCIDAVNALVADANMLSKSAVEGKLATRADATKHQGDFRKIVQGVNETLDAVIGPLNVSAEYVDRISKGDIPNKITDNYNGDFNEIKNNLNKCIDAVNRIVADAVMLSKAAVEGKLATRADASKHDGDFKKIVQGVNETLDAVIGPLNVAAKYVDDISKGVIPPVITDNYNGDFNIIKTNLNTVVKMMSDLLKETDVIIQAAADGELDKRANATLFVGGWNELISGINDTITNIVNPLMVTADYVDKVSKGVIPPEITTVYKGQYNIIKNNLNSVVKMMSELLSETDKLVKAAINGQLETRANASLFVGGWNQLVSGINQTLETILGPINEAAAVLEKVAARDMTARVMGDYKGDLAKIKNALNTAVDNLDKALQQVTEATEQVSSASVQISSGSQSLAQGANEQASSLEEVSSSLEEMASMTKQNADNANQAKGLAGESDSNAKSGTEAMTRMSGAINRIKESSDQTAKIVKTIDEIAMQTNLLALNAAVEAARAGEAGRGFAVVAEEVRNLAQRSAQAAKNTADMITESVKNADDGVKIAVEVSQSFETIATSAKKVNDLIAEIAAASQEQSSGIEQINTAVAQMDKVTQQNAANSEESASASEQLNSQSEELKNMIGQFALSHSAVTAVSTARKPMASHTMVHTGSREKPGMKAIPKKHSGKTTTIRPEDIIPMDDEALKEF